MAQKIIDIVASELVADSTGGGHVYIVTTWQGEYSVRQHIISNTAASGRDEQTLCGKRVNDLYGFPVRSVHMYAGLWDPRITDGYFADHYEDPEAETMEVIWCKACKRDLRARAKAVGVVADVGKV